jgi:hypothetical protein
MWTAFLKCLDATATAHAAILVIVQHASRLDRHSKSHMFILEASNYTSLLCRVGSCNPSAPVFLLPVSISSILASPVTIISIYGLPRREALL